MAEKYKNPSQSVVDDILNSVKNAESHDEVMKIINDVYPNWIINSLPSYSPDYPHFTKNWKTVCEKIKCEPLNVIIVDELVMNNKDYSLIQQFADLLTLFGHSIKPRREFISCKFCSSAIPIKELYEKCKNAKLQVPESWSMKCKNC